jgi:hypothetical protein
MGAGNILLPDFAKRVKYVCDWVYGAADQRGQLIYAKTCYATQKQIVLSVDYVILIH